MTAPGRDTLANGHICRVMVIPNYVRTYTHADHERANRKLMSA